MTCFHKSRIKTRTDRDIGQESFRNFIEYQFETSEKSFLAKPQRRQELFLNHFATLRLCVSRTFGIIKKSQFITVAFFENGHKESLPTS